jgi:hypothetical protein
LLCRIGKGKQMYNNLKIGKYYSGIHLFFSQINTDKKTADFRRLPSPDFHELRTFNTGLKYVTCRQ